MGLPISYLPPEVPNPNPTDGPGSYYSYRKRSKQARPYNLPAAYELRRVYTKKAAKFGSTTTFGGYASASSATGDYLVQPDLTQTAVINKYIDHAVFKARNALIGTLNEQALVATNYIERRQAFGMMADRLHQLVDFARAVRRGDKRSALWILRNKSSSSRRRKHVNAKDMADTWLEFHFGWEPLVKDIFSVMKLLSDPLPGGYVCTDDLPYPPGKVRFTEEQTGTLNGATAYPTKWSRKCEGFAKAKAGTEFYVSNPNLYLLNRLGIVNPAAVAWEAIPFSFVVDWFTSTSQWINQYSDLYGITVRNPWYSWRARASSIYDIRTTYRATGAVVEGMHVEKDAFHSRRLLGIPEVTLKVLPAKRISVVRAVTAIALLIQLLPKYRTSAEMEGLTVPNNSIGD